MTYTERDVTGRIDRLLLAHDLTGELGTRDLERIALLDQFHVGGTAAVDRTISPLGIHRHHRVIDVGSGFGGPARRIAVRTGARVHGIDIADEYVRAARSVTAKANLDERVTFERVAVEDHAPVTPYDAAVTMHVQMSVPDKVRWFSAIRSHLRTGSPLGVWEVVRADHPTGPLTFPLPWSIDGTDSHLATGGGLRSDIERAGFRTREWVVEDAWIIDWFQDVLAEGFPDGPSLTALIDDGVNRAVNLFAAIDAGLVSVRRGWFLAR
jgi:SAM-dependent methyltransferase